MHRLFHASQLVVTQSALRIRIAISGFIIASFVAGLVAFKFSVRLQKKWRQLCASLLLHVLQVRTQTPSFERPDFPFLIAANHISYLDVLVLEVLFSPTFITSMEVKEDRWLGKLCQWAGCVFVERRHRSQLINDLKILKNRIEKGETLCLFPEGTTSDGTQILPLRSSLLQIAVDHRLPILPVYLQYEEKTLPARAPYLKQHRCFFSHFLDLFRSQGIRAQVSIGSLMSISNHRKDCCSELESALTHLSGRSQQILTDSLHH